MRFLPLFPLNTVLFPGGQLSLQVFEVRYLDMIRYCVNNNTSFGIVSLTSGSEIRLPGKTETFSQVGTLVNILQCTSLRPGLLQVVCEGTTRFKIYSIEQQRHGLWTAEVVDMIEHDKEITIPDELIDTSTSLESLLYSMKKQGLNESELTVNEPYRLNDCGWVANRWAELLPISLSQKQNLLALENPLLRLELIQDELAERDMLT
jgi:Lon protease-like protein